MANLFGRDMALLRHDTTSEPLLIDPGSGIPRQQNHRAEFLCRPLTATILKPTVRLVDY
jgi:hypothetical protein